MLLVSQEGVCIDIDTHSDLWFLKEELLLGKAGTDFPERGRRTKARQPELQAGAAGRHLLFQVHHASV